jgi:hypothetical protein
MKSQFSAAFAISPQSEPASKISIAGYLVFPDFRRQGLQCILDATTMPDDGAARVRTPEVVNRIRFLINMQQYQLCPKYSSKRYRVLKRRFTFFPKVRRHEDLSDF